MPKDVNIIQNNLTRKEKQVNAQYNGKDRNTHICEQFGDATRDRVLDGCEDNLVENGDNLAENLDSSANLTPVKLVIHDAWCELTMYPPQQLHQPRRRKKRPAHGLKTVEVSRGKSGYGFTISGQHPCVLSCIVNNSPADKVGLRPGDYLISVNGLDVSRHSHDDVVCMVGTSTGTLTIQVVENYNSSDSSDDEHYQWAKSKYRARRGHRADKYSEKMDKLLADISNQDRHCPDGTSHDPTSRPLAGMDKIDNNKKADQLKARSSRPRLHMPVGAENHEIQAVGTSYIEAGATNMFKVPFQKSISCSNVPATSSVPTRNRVEPKQAFIKSTSQGQFNAKQTPTNQHSYPSRSHATPHLAQMSRANMYDQFSPNSLQQIINHSLHSYSAANEAFIMNEDETDSDDEDDDDEEEGPFSPEGEMVRIVVGYIGSLEMPGDPSQPHVRIQSIRNAVRRLRVEQKIHTLVLMIVTPYRGVTLVNMSGKEIAFYPVERLAFSGVCPDDKRFFGIVTLRRMADNSDSDGASREETQGCACHIFMVDPELTAHNVHATKARSFGFDCTMAQGTQRCVEFPRSTTPIIMSISNLYKDRPNTSVENDMERSQVFANPNRQIEHVRTSSSSSNNSNSDSGLGLCRDDNRPSRGVGVVVEDPTPPPVPARPQPPPPQLPQVKWSGNTMYLMDGPVRQARTSSSSLDQVDTTHTSSRSTATPNLDASTSPEMLASKDKLNVRALPGKSPGRNSLPGDGFEDQNAAEKLRQGMQKLLQTRQKTSPPDHTSSDTESRSSHTGSDLTRSASDRFERPVSAPFKYLSNEHHSDSKLTKNKYNHIKQDSDSSLADKLSPRAFLSSAFSPVEGRNSAYKKGRSKSRPHQEMRSPSAPPIPSYHGDDEDSDEEGVNSIIKRFQKEHTLGLTTDSIELLKGEHSIYKQRDQERKGVTPLGSPEEGSGVVKERWSGVFQNGLSPGKYRSKNHRNPLSLSHESLVVLDQDSTPNKLSSASSVNSIVSHVATATEREEVGRVTSWAVNFDKLLRDRVGIAVFKEFLKKEFSEENIEFWQTCEDYRNIADPKLRKAKAREVYDKHVAMHSSDPVNIDSALRKGVEAELTVDNPPPTIFLQAQQHIYQLMKQDSYVRFLKSEVYRSYMMAEMEGQALKMPGATSTDPRQVLATGNTEAGKKKGKNGKDGTEENKERRRRSLLPWRQKSKKQGNKNEKNENDAKNLKPSKDNKDNNMNDLPLKCNAPTTIDTVASKRDLAQIAVPATIDEEAEQPRFCRVIMPDGSTTVVGTRHGQSIHHILGKLCEKRSLSIASVDVFLLGSDKPLNLNEDISTLGSKEVTIERRVLFRMDLPNKKCIGVKAKPNRLIRDVFKPILNKYGFRMETIDVHLCGQSESLCLDDIVSSIDSQRVIVLLQPPTETPDPVVKSPKVETVDLTVCSPSRDHPDAADPGPEVTNRGVAGRKLRNKQKVTFALPKHSHQNQASNTAGGSSSKERSKNVGLAPLPDGAKQNNIENVPDAASNTSINVQKHTDGIRNHDTGGTHSHNLPRADVTKAKGQNEKKSEAEDLDHESSDKRASRDLMTEIDDYIESIHENFAAYTRDSAVTGSPNVRKSLGVLDTPKSAIKSSNKSFTEDGVIPDNDDADSFFRGSPPTEDFFGDSYFLEKDFKDEGLSYNYNKYLAKSRNFVTQRNKFISDSQPVSVQLTEPAKWDKIASPKNKVMTRGASAGSLETTYMSSSHLQHNNSDSSLERNYHINPINPTPKPGFQRHSRHTFLHSPITSSSDESSLSAVDTDGSVLQHCRTDHASDEVTFV
ncbi:regulator of G-protein signaling loco-like isoform X3 [Mya arenaria]|uniref:regulator of G-protein signaling loco-like isoform X3 n=1 Tax=Mya arenaria TaxID=6604 RepID=UPI0022E92FA1|nr:regulator of G-protein signaling loco-like isoform X3 [Mya arenaria]